MYNLKRISKEHTYVVSSQKNRCLYLYHWTNLTAMKSILGLSGNGTREIKGNDARGQINFFPSFNKLSYKELVSQSRTRRPLEVSIQKPGEMQYLLEFKFDMPKNLNVLVHFTSDLFASVSTTLDLALQANGYGVPRVVHFLDKNDIKSFLNSMLLSDINNSWHTSFDLGTKKNLNLFLTFEGITTTAYYHEKRWNFKEFKKYDGFVFFNELQRKHNKFVKSVSGIKGKKINIVQKT